jgi:hypothetical protein
MRYFANLDVPQKQTQDVALGDVCEGRFPGEKTEHPFVIRSTPSRKNALDETRITKMMEADGRETRTCQR